MTLLLLYLLASLDGGLCGYRTALGRCPRINKRDFYIRGVMRGLVGAQLASWISLAALLGAYFLVPDQVRLRQDLQIAAGRMIVIFLPYAALVLANLVLRLVPSIDLRSATSVFFLGPLTAIRPAVMVLGVVYGIWRAELPVTIGLGIFVLFLMLALEFLLNVYNQRLQRGEIESLVPAKF